MTDLPTLVARAVLTEATWKTMLCGGTAAVIALLLPYSTDFALQTVTQLGFAVALTEGVLSMLADLFDAPGYALKKIVEGVETLIASMVLALATLTLQAVS
ncbi:MAG TPA: hypothetical protein VHM01_16150 [Alphaproteobacteria bacterium]|nr:hypothetical protein [Alphaproteobacteria bacterium]